MWDALHCAPGQAHHAIKLRCCVRASVTARFDPLARVAGQCIAVPCARDNGIEPAVRGDVVVAPAAVPMGSVSVWHTQARCISTRGTGLVVKVCLPQVDVLVVVVVVAVVAMNYEL